MGLQDAQEIIYVGSSSGGFGVVMLCDDFAHIVK